MEKIFEILLNNSFGALLGESNHYLRAKGLFAAVQILEAWRKVTLLYFSAIMAFVLFVACLFSAIFYNLSSVRGRLDLLNLMFLFLSCSSVFYLTWSLREKRWIRMFKLDEKIYSLKIRARSTDLRQKESTISDHDLRKEIFKMVDERLSYYLEDQKGSTGELAQ